MSGGAEDDDYAAAGRPYGAKDAPFESIAEVEQVLGMTPAIYAKVEPFLTVFSGNGTPDASYAAPEVLAAMGLDAAGIVARRRQWDPASGQPPPVLADGQPLSDGGTGTYSIWSRARLRNGRETVLHAIVRSGGNGLPGRRTRRCSGRKEHRRNDRPTRTPRRAKTARGRFFRLVGTQPRRMAAPRLARRAGVDRGRLLLGVDGDALQLRLQDGDGLRDIGRMPLPTELEVDGNDVLAAVLSPSLAELPRWLLLPGRLPAPPSGVARGRRGAVARRGRFRNRPADAVRRRRRRLRRAPRFRAAMATGNSTPNWWWCRARR